LPIHDGTDGAAGTSEGYVTQATEAIDASFRKREPARGSCARPVSLNWLRSLAADGADERRRQALAHLREVG
jgi:hypothetical protein